jgi:hypothetical protein
VLSIAADAQEVEMQDKRSAGSLSVKAVFCLMVASAVWASSVAAAVLTQYSFESNGNDTAAGGVTVDNLADNGTITYAPGVVGQGVSLAGGYLSAADSADLDLGGATWTMECFIRDGLVPALWKRIVWKWTLSTQIHWALRNSKLDLFVNGASVIPQAGPALNDGGWHHLAMANDSTNGVAGLRAWVDGVPVHSGAGIMVNDTASPFWLGHGVDSFTGLIDELIIHDDAKDQAYIDSRAALLTPVVTEYSFENSLNDTAVGGTASDALSYMQGASGNGGPVYMDGVVGKAAVFDGNYFFAADSADVGLTGTDWAIEAFIKASAHNALWDRLILKWDVGTDYHLALETGDLNLFEGSPANVFDTNTVPATDFTVGWHHIAVSSSNTGAEAWIDGTSVWSGAAVTLTRSADLLCLGDSAGDPNPGSRFNGWMDEVRLHASAVDQAYVDSRAALLPDDPLSLLDAGVSNATITVSNATVYATLQSPVGTVDTAAVWVVWSDAGDQGTNSLSDWGTNTAYQGIAAVNDQANATVGGALSADTLYTFRLFATNSVDSEHAWSDAAIFATDLTVAQAPVFTSAVYSAGMLTITLGWANNASNLTGYVLQRATVDNPADYVTVQMPGLGVRSQADPISAAGTYYYRLAATNTVNSSGTGLENAKTNITVVTVDPLLTRYSFESNGNDTATGGTTVDNLAPTGTITYAPGVVGQAVSLADGYLIAADSDELDLGTAAWTVECFIKDGLASAGWKRLVWKWDPSTQLHWAFENSKFDLHANGVSVINQVGPLLNDGKWHHIAMANDSNANTLKAWVDGQLVYSGAGITVADTVSPFRLGHGEDRFTGLVDEFTIHGEAKDTVYVQSRAMLSQDYTTDPMANPFIIDGSPAYAQATHDAGTWRSGHIFDGDSVTDYASASAGTNTFLTFDFGRTVTIGSFGHHNRGGGGETVLGSTLTFSRNAVFGDGDDRIVNITHTRQQSMAIYDMGSRISARYVSWQTTGPGVGVNRGAREIKFFATRYRTVTNPVITQVSSEWNTVGPYAPDTGPNPDFHASNVFDDRDDGFSDAGEAWACFEETATPWLEFDFGVPTLVAGVNFSDRQLAFTYFLTSKLVFSQDAVFGNGDDVTVDLTHIRANDAAANYSRSEFLPIEEQKARYVRWQGVTNTGADPNSGITELSFVTTVAPPPGTLLIVR